jgi:hypothetical protein
VVVCALTIIEAVHAGTNKARLNGVLSGLRAVPVGDEEAKASSSLLTEAGPGPARGCVRCALCDRGVLSLS